VARSNADLSLPQLLQVCGQRFGADDIYGLSKLQASQLIDEFKGGDGRC